MVLLLMHLARVRWRGGNQVPISNGGVEKALPMRAIARHEFNMGCAKMERHATQNTSISRGRFQFPATNILLR